MLNQIIVPNTICFHISHDFLYNIILMITWENHLFFHYRLSNSILNHFFLFFHKGNETVNQIKHTVSLKYFFPQITSIISIWISWISCSSSYTCSIRPLIKWQEMSISIRQLCSHPSLI